MKKIHHDHWKRSLVKSITYRVIIMVVVFMVSYVVTHKANEALVITSWNAVLATTIYYWHERIWTRIGWGRN